METAAFAVGGLSLAGLAAASISYMSAAEAAAVINAGISASADCITTAIKGGQCTLKNASISAAFSLGMGGLGGIAAKTIGAKTVGSLLALAAVNGAIQAGGYTLQRTIRGDSTNTNQAAANWGSGLVATGIQMLDGNVYALSHIAEAVASIFDAAGTYNTDPSVTLIP